MAPQSPPHLLAPLDSVLTMFNFIKDIKDPAKSKTPVDLVGSSFDCHIKDSDGPPKSIQLLILLDLV